MRQKYPAPSPEFCPSFGVVLGAVILHFFQGSWSSWTTSIFRVVGSLMTCIGASRGGSKNGGNGGHNYIPLGLESELSLGTGGSPPKDGNQQEIGRCSEF